MGAGQSLQAPPSKIAKDTQSPILKFAIAFP